jgi:SAM-dependent methyltransferase
MHKQFLFGPFYRKHVHNGVQVTDNIYADPDFARFYNQTVDYGSDFNDLDFYRQILNKDDVILEIGSGNGRVFNILAAENYHIYGIEPEREMIQYILEDFKGNIFHNRIEDLSCLAGKHFSKVIIPATTVSLFSEEILTDFFSGIKTYLMPGGSIIFDIIHPESAQKSAERIQTVRTKEGTFFIGNFIIGEYYVLNIYMKNRQTEKIGYSKKKLYSVEYFRRLAKNLHYELRELHETSVFQFLELTNNG